VADYGLLRNLSPRIRLATSPRPVATLAVTPNYFSMLGLFVWGRDFEPADDVFGAPAVRAVSTLLRQPDSAFTVATPAS
jgi:hypothetical protein